MYYVTLSPNNTTHKTKGGFMSFNKYDTYSIISNSESSKKEDISKILIQIEELKDLNTESEVRDWLKTNWNIQENINYFTMSDNITVTLSNSQNYFNLTMQEENKVKTYNYLRERSV